MQRRLSLVVLIADLAWSLVAMVIALALRYGVRWIHLDRGSTSPLFPFFGVAFVIWALFSFVLPLDGFQG